MNIASEHDIKITSEITNVNNKKQGKMVSFSLITFIKLKLNFYFLFFFDKRE